jgi:outer membrane protein OmpA-like peptidoglycan-associated protein
VGNDQANQTLSENRAKAVFAYLIANKINPERLVYKGYGKTQPIAANTTEEDRSKNRRTEFKIIAK